MFRFKNFILLLTITTGFAGVSAVAQQSSPRKAPAPAQRTAPAKAQSRRANPLKTVDARRQFVIDVVNSAVALPQPDQQDRLRVLNSAAGVISPVRPAIAKQFAREGIRIEQELIQQGETPAVSLLNSGYVDCASIPTFIENIPVDKVEMADQSLVGAITLCQKQGLEPARRKLETALDQGHVAARPLLALIEATGPKTQWSQDTFAKMFSSLPSPDSKASRTEAPNYAAMFSQMAPMVDKAVAKTAGVKFLVWLGKLPDSGEKNLSLNIATDSLKQTLGEKAYEEALASDVMARQAAQSAGQPGELEHPEEESVSVLQAMGKTSTDRTAELNGMPSSLRAREAAASGFATGTSGNKSQAGKYFDIAFSALNDVWDNRTKVDAPAVVEEVSEAAAHVDAVDALQRAQRLQDPSARAIGMIAVARVVAGGESSPVAEQR